MPSLRSNWPGARREGGGVSPAILDRLSNEAPGQFQRNPKGGMSFGRRRCCSLPYKSTSGYARRSRLASAQNPLPRMYSYFGDTALVQGFQAHNTGSSPCSPPMTWTEQSFNTVFPALVRIFGKILCAAYEIFRAFKSQSQTTRRLPRSSGSAGPGYARVALLPGAEQSAHQHP